MYVLYLRFWTFTDDANDVNATRCVVGEILSDRESTELLINSFRPTSVLSTLPFKKPAVM